MRRRRRRRRMRRWWGEGKRERKTMRTLKR